ncbi:MAG: trigger factor [Alphaproteobacteria bacterium]
MKHILNIKETRSNGLEKEFEITIAGHFIEEKIEAALKAKATTVSLPGFRPGKAPLPIVRQRYGAEIIDETLNNVLGHVSEEVLGEKKLKPATHPHYHMEKEYEAGKDFAYRLHFEIMPSIKPVDVKSLEITEYKIKANAEDIQTMNKILADSRKKKEACSPKHKSQLGDVLTIAFTGKLNGKVLPQATADSYDLELGSKSFIEGFEEGLLNHSAGDEVVLNLTFPKAYHSKDLAGKVVEFTVQIKEISQQVAQEVNDDFAKSLGYKDLAELELEHQRMAEGANKKVAMESIKQEVLDTLDKLYDFEVPPRMARIEFENICRQLEAELPEKEQEEHRKNNFEDWKKEYQPVADRRVRLGLILADISNHHKVGVDPRDLSNAILQEAQSYPGQEKQVIDYYKTNQDALSYLRASLLENKVIDFIVKNAKLSPKEVTREELKKIEEARELAFAKRSKK